MESWKPQKYTLTTCCWQKQFTGSLKKAVEEKQLRVDIVAVRESLKCKEIIVQWIDNKGQLADVFTKQGANSQVLIDVIKYGQI